MMIKVIMEQIVSLLKPIHDCNRHKEINYSYLETKDKLNIITHDGSSIVQDIFITNLHANRFRRLLQIAFNAELPHMNNVERLSLKRTSF